jgi:large subunit ribosomal protein L4
VHVVSAFVEGEVPSTKAALATLGKVTASAKVLAVVHRDDVVAAQSLRNVPTVHVIEVGQINTYDVLVADDIVFTQAALASLVEGPARGKGARAVATAAGQEG